MKKLFTIFLSLLMLFSATTLFACKNEEQSDVKQLSFYAPDGAPALAVAKFIKDKEDFGIDGEISYNVVSSSEIGGIMSQGKGDFIVMPINAASKLYKANSDSPYVMASVITHGNLYIMSSDGTNSLSGLKGKVVGVIGRGLVPDLTLRAILSQEQLLADVVEDDTATDGKITLRYFADASEMLPMLKQGKLSVGLLPEPAATKLTVIAPDKTWTRLDVQELYDAETKSYPQAVLMVKKSVYEPFRNQINQMANLFAENVNWIKTNTEEAVNAVNSRLKEGVTPSLVASNITPAVVDNCKIYYQSAKNAKADVTSYLNKIMSIDDKAVKIVGDDFFAN